MNGEYGYNPESEKLKELQTQAFELFQQEKGLIYSFVREGRTGEDTESIFKMAIFDFVGDRVNDFILSADKGKLKDFIDKFNFRYSMYKNNVKDYFRTAEFRHGAGPILEDRKEMRGPLISASSLDPDVQATDRMAYHNDLLAEIDRKLSEITNIENFKPLKRMLTFIKKLVYGYTVQEAAHEIGMNGIEAYKMYNQFRNKYPDIFGVLPEQPSELKSGSKYWGGRGKSYGPSMQKDLNLERRKNMDSLLGPLLEEIQSPLTEDQHHDLTDIAGKEVAVQIIKYYLGEISRDEIDCNIHVFRQIREVLAKKIGFRSLPIHPSSEGREHKAVVSYKQLEYAVRLAGITTVDQYKEEYNNYPDWPSAPDKVYKGEWKSWVDFFGKERVKFLSLAHLKEEVKAAGITDSREYKEARKNHSSWPSSPQVFYYPEWPGWKEFADKGFLTYSELKSEAKAAGVKNSIEYKDEYKKHSSWPSNPDKSYADRWRGWDDFLDKEMSPEERKAASDRALIAQGKTPFTDEEEEFIQELAEDPRYRRGERVNAAGITEEVNRKFHGGKQVRTARGVTKNIIKNKNRAERIEDRNVVKRLEDERNPLRRQIEKEIPKLLGSIIKMVNKSGLYEKVDPNDVLQETMRSAVKSIKQFRGDAKLSTWLYSIARNIILMHLRKIKREPTQRSIDDENFPTLAAEVPDDGADFLLRDKLNKVLNKLTPEDREVMQLYLEGNTQDEAAAKLNISPAAYKSRFYRAKEKVKELLKSSYGDIDE